MAFKQINQLSQYMNEDSMLETYARGGKHFLLTKGGEIEIDQTTFGALNNGKPQVEGKYILNFDKIRKAWKVQTGTSGEASGTAFAQSDIGQLPSDLYLKKSFDYATYLPTLTYVDGLCHLIETDDDRDGILSAYKLEDLSEEGIIGTGYAIGNQGCDFYYATDSFTVEGEQVNAGWQSKVDASGKANYGTPSSLGEISSINETAGWNGIWASKTAFSTVTYDYFFEFKNGEIVKLDDATAATVYNAIVTNQNGFYAINGDTNPVYYNQLGLIRAWTDGTNKFAQLINGDILPVSNTQWASFTSGSYPFAEVVDDTIYFNANKFIKLVDNNTGKFIEFKGGQRIAVDQQLFTTIKGDLTKIGDKYYYDTTQIVRGTSTGNPEEVKITDASSGLGTFTVNMSIYKSATSSSTEQKTFSYNLKNTATTFVTQQASGTKVYFNKFKTTAQIKTLLGMVTEYSPTTHKANLLNTFLFAEQINDATGYAIGFVVGGETIYVYASEAFTPEGGTEIQAGWQHLTGDYYEIESETITDIASQNDFNGKLVAKSTFEDAYEWQIGSTDAPLATYGIAITGSAVDGSTFKSQYFVGGTFEGKLCLNNGIQIPVDYATYSAITSGFKALSGVKTNPVEIYKVFRVGTNPNYKYIAEIKTGYQIEITQAEYNAIAGIV